MRLILAIGAGVCVWTLSRGPRLVSLPRPPAWWAFSLALGMLAGFLTGRPSAVSLAVGAVPIAWVEGRRRVLRRRATARLSSRWPDFLALVRGRIATGEPLPDAVRVAARSMGDAFAPLDRAWGGSFGEGLAEIQMEWADPLADRVLTTIRVAAETGGAYVDSVLSSLALSLSDELRLRRAHEAAVAQQQMTAGVALVAPWLILVLSLTTNPQANAEFSTASGHSVLVIGAGATVVGFALARRALRLSDPPRVFG
jgi:tight adherence protein B